MDSNYQYLYENTSSYCYKNTDVLINKLNITNDKILYEAERELVSLRLLELNEFPIKGSFNFKHLKRIHKYLFKDIYSWAGKIRICNISKIDLFCLAEHINTYGNDIFRKLKNEKYYYDYDNETTLIKLVELFSDINALHTFREGNGRTQRIFIETLAKINGIRLDLTNVSRLDMIKASHDGIECNYERLINIFKKNSYTLSDEEKAKYINIYCSDKVKNIIGIKK